MTGVISWQKRLSVSDSVTKKPDTVEVLFLGGPPQFLLTCKVGWDHILPKGVEGIGFYHTCKRCSGRGLIYRNTYYNTSNTEAFPFINSVPFLSFFV